MLMKKMMFFLSLFLVVLFFLTRILNIDFYGLSVWGIYLLLTPIVYSSLMLFDKRGFLLKKATWFTIGCAISILLSNNYEFSVFGCKLITLSLGWLIVYVINIIYHRKNSK